MDQDLKKIINESIDDLLNRKDNACYDLIHYEETDLPIGGEKKYSKQEPGGEMMASNLEEKSFRVYNNLLCPVLWDVYQHLDARVRVNLLRTAYDFYKHTEFKAPIVDIFLMGSIANYNWTSDSDADIHIIIDYNKLQIPIESIGEIIKTISGEWNAEHNISVKSHKVEINFQNLSEQKPHVTGIYSLVKDQWIRKPSRQNIKIDKALIQQKFAEMQKYINSAIQSGNRDVMKVAKKFINDYRQSGLDTHGELSTENIVFKILRAKGLIKSLKSSIISTYDKEMSVSEIVDEVTQKDVKSRHPQSKDQWNNDWTPKLKMMSLDNIKAMQEKEGRFWDACIKSGDKEGCKLAMDRFIIFNNELKRRLKYINSPITENKKGILLGDCRNEELIDTIFGSVSEFARQVEENGDNFVYDGIIIKYNSKSDIHYFWEIQSPITETENIEHNFTLLYNQPDIANGSAKIMLGNEWFGNTYKFPDDSGKYSGKWVFNAHSGAMNRKFPGLQNGYNTPEDILLDLEKWYLNSRKLNESNSMHDKQKKMFKLIMKKVTDNILKDTQTKVFGGKNRLNNRRAMDAYDINCGLCEEWANEVERIYKEKTGEENVHIHSGMGHYYINFIDRFYDVECQEGVVDFHELPLFKDNVKEGYGTENPDEDPKAVGRWTVKFDSDSRKLNESNDYNAAVDFSERRDRQLCDLATLLKNSKGKGRVPWKTVSASLLKKTWLLFGKYNKINDNAIDKIADQILTNIARLNASTAMMGHSTYDVRPEIEDNCGITFNDKEWDDWMSTYFTNNEGSWMLSDYGLPKLEHLYYEIFNAKTSEEKLYAIDKALNVIHQRNDLAAMFVEGGSKTLLDIANQGGYVSPDDIKEGIGWHGAYQAILLSNPSSLVFAENDEDTHIEIVNRIFKKEMKEFMSQFEKSGYGDEDDPECKYLAANSLAEKYNLARCIIENDQILYVNTPKNKELSNSQLRVLKDYCIEHKLRLKHSNCMGKGTCEIDLSEGYGTGNPDEDPKAVGRWTVKFDSDSKILKENHKLPLSAFTSGYCAEFALALHERTGYPIVSFDENIKHDEDDIETQSIHYACKHKNLYYDAKGKRNEEEIRKSLIGSDMNPAVNVSIRKLTADYLENETEIVDDALEQARQIVGKMKNIGEGFDPTSCGPNPQATEGQPQDPNFYQDNINKMRQLEEDSINENFDVSVKNLIKSVVDSNISKILKESMDVYIKGYNYSRKLNKLEDLTNHLLDKALLPGLKSLPADQLTYFQKNKIGTVYDMLTPDGDYWQGPSGGVGTINFYTAGLTTKTIRKVLLDILRECKKLNIKVDKLKIEDSKMFKKSQVIRISIIKNKNEYSGPPELNMSNINGYHMFKQILQFEPDDNYGSSFSMKTQDLIDRINAINGDKDWVSQNIRKPTDSKNDQSDTPESGEDWKQETEPEDSDNPHDAIIKQLGQGGARMIGGGLNSDAIHERLSKIMEIALWAKKHGFEEMYIS